MQPSDIHTVAPEAALAFMAMIGLLAGAYGRKDAWARGMTRLVATVLAVLAVWVAVRVSVPISGFAGGFMNDAFARFAKVAILLSASVALFMSASQLQERGLARFEFPLLAAFAITGMMVMVSASDLMVMYMGLELQSLSLYVMVAINRDSRIATEAGLKYFVLGALSSGILLFGASLVYGFAGTTLFTGIAQAINASGNPPSTGFLIGMVLVIAGLAFKVSAVPFHMWTPDVYQGAPTPITAFLAAVPKIAAMALFARVLYGAFGGISDEWQQVLAILAVLSMFVGALSAIGQTDIKRLMAFSSITHMGFALLALAAGTQAGIQAMLLYMVVYAIMSLGVFAFVLTMHRAGLAVTEIASLQMLLRSAPDRALAMLCLLFSLAGLPPFLGFFAKFQVLRAAVEGGLIWFVVAGVVAVVIASYYYIRMVYLMFFGADPEEPLEHGNTNTHYIVLMVSALAMLAGVVNFLGIEGFALAASGALLG